MQFHTLLKSKLPQKGVVGNAYYCSDSNELYVVVGDGSLVHFSEILNHAPVTVQGPQGSAGVDGAPGPQGPQGPVGPRGAQGDTGERGQPGINVRGERGEAGPQGSQGSIGATGPQGLTGPIGPTGERGGFVYVGGPEVKAAAEVVRNQRLQMLAELRALELEAEEYPIGMRHVLLNQLAEIERIINA